jgi:hypothetical protein
MIGQDRPDGWWLPGFESIATEISRDAARRLTVRKAAPPCEGTVIGHWRSSWSRPRPTARLPAPSPCHLRTGPNSSAGAGSNDASVGAV